MIELCTRSNIVVSMVSIILLLKFLYIAIYCITHVELNLIMQMRLPCGRYSLLLSPSSTVIIRRCQYDATYKQYQHSEMSLLYYHFQALQSSIDILFILPPSKQQQMSVLYCHFQALQSSVDINFIFSPSSNTNIQKYQFHIDSKAAIC